MYHHPPPVYPHPNTPYYQIHPQPQPTHPMVALPFPPTTAVGGKRRRDDFEGATASSCYYSYPHYYAQGHQFGDSFDVSVTNNRDDGDGSVSKRAKSQDVIFRIVVPSRQIGKVIGKEGCRIQKIREDTQANIKIADAIARHEERVIIISSSKERENTVSDAENALQQIAALILKEDESSLEAPKPAAAGHVAANTIRLLIAGTQAGSLIGVSGQNIEKLRESSGATITVLAPNQLPLCASALESDRIVQISGNIPDVVKALEEIGCQLRENPPRQVISISPAYNYCTVRPPQTYVDPTSADYVTLEMMISETLVGGLIGRCGSNISRIRSESGAMIKVYGGKGAQKHRQIQFGGSAQQVALAKQRVDEYIYSQLVQQADTEQTQDKAGRPTST